MRKLYHSKIKKVKPFLYSSLKININLLFAQKKALFLFNRANELCVCGLFKEMSEIKHKEQDVSGGHRDILNDGALEARDGENEQGNEHKGKCDKRSEESALFFNCLAEKEEDKGHCAASRKDDGADPVACAAGNAEIFIHAVGRAVDGNINCDRAEGAEDNAEPAAVAVFTIGVHRIHKYRSGCENAPQAEGPGIFKPGHTGGDIGEFIFESCLSYNAVFDYRYIKEAVPVDKHASCDQEDNARGGYALIEGFRIEDLCDIEDEKQKAHAGDDDPDGIEQMSADHTGNIGLNIGRIISADPARRLFFIVEENYIFHKEGHPYAVNGGDDDPHYGVTLRHFFILKFGHDPSPLFIFHFLPFSHISGMKKSQ